MSFAEWFFNFPPEIATMILAMIPLTELRASIPIGIGVYGLSAQAALFWSIIGDVVPMIFILTFIDPVSEWLMKKSKIFNRFFTWLFARTKHRFSDKYHSYGALALMVFTAIPLPVTGAWTAAVAAFLFGIPKTKAMAYIGLGVVISGILVTLIYTGFISFAQILL